ncbi:MAG: hypothetical protein F6J93_34575 [Oscillatoria sp. SIO1A7]|nr:hypothetical protein [Oscillatoria sp. SIO1A7]
MIAISRIWYIIPIAPPNSHLPIPNSPHPTPHTPHPNSYQGLPITLNPAQ